jgi:hypothetical protein
MRCVEGDNSIARRKIFAYEDRNRSSNNEAKNCSHHFGKHGNHSYYEILEGGEGKLSADSSEEIVYEKSIHCGKEICPQLVTSSFRKDRRVLFGSYIQRGNGSSFQRSHSCVTLNRRFVSANARNALSDSELVYIPSKKLVSCLKPSTYSIHDSPTKKRLIIPSSHVSFDVHINVLKYDIPSEQWAPPGWSDFFNQ